MYVCNPTVGAYSGARRSPAVVAKLVVTEYAEYDAEIAEATYEAVAEFIEYEAVSEYDADVIDPVTPSVAETEPDTTELFLDINPLRAMNSFGMLIISFHCPTNVLININ
jgi:hypothetical protein